MSQHFENDQEVSETTYTPVPSAQEISQTGLEPGQQQSREKVEDIHSLLRYVNDKPVSIPWGVIACLSLPQLYSLCKMYMMVHSLPAVQMATVGVREWLFSCLLGLLVPTSYMWYAISTRRDQNIDAEIGPLDVRWIGGLIEAMDDPKPRIRSLAKRLLARLLSRFKASDASLLTPEIRQQLYAILQRNARADTDLIHGILRAVARIGDADALPYVEPLTEQMYLRRLGEQATLRLPNRKDIRRAAIACAEALERRIDSQDRLASLALAPLPSDSEVTADFSQPENSAANAKVLALVEQLREQRRTNGQPQLRWHFLFAAWLTIVPYTAWNAVQSALANEWFFAAVWGVGFGLAVQLHRYLLSPTMTEAARKLATYDDIQGIGVLAEALEWPDTEIQTIAEAALTRLLPRLKSSDASLLNAEQRGCLYRMLGMRTAVYHSQFTLVLLKTLEQVGDSSAVPYVARLANSLPITPMRRKIRQAAIDCLPYLTNRAEQQRASETLLRASSPANTDPAILLRATGEVNTSDPRQLLRPGSGNETLD